MATLSVLVLMEWLCFVSGRENNTIIEYCVRIFLLATFSVSVLVTVLRVRNREQRERGANRFVLEIFLCL